jgi:hypothetical protein
MANELNYASYDFDDAVDQLIARLQASDATKDTYRSSTGEMLVELYAYVANLVLYYIERRAEETYLATAKNKSSVINIVRALNYTPKRKVSATGYLTFSINTPIAYSIFIPKYTECQTASGIKYVTSEDTVLLAGQSSVTVAAIQGEKILIEQTADGVASQEFKISSDSVENTNLRFLVDGVEWTLVTSFINSIATSLHYMLRTELDDTVTVLVGDGVNGAIPASGSTINTIYVKSDGANGNAYSAGVITTVNSVLYDITGTIQTLTVTNADTFLGGDGAEDIEEIRYEAPRVFKTGDRLVTKDDYIAVLENYAGVANANAWGENEETAPDYTMFNTVRLVVLLENWAIPGTSFKSTLSTYLYTKSMMTVKYEFITPEIIYVIPTLIVKCDKGVSLADTQDSIEEVISDLFVLGTTTRLGVSKRIGDVIAAVEGVSGVSYSHVTLDIYKALDTGSTYDYYDTLEAVDITPGSVRLYDGTTLMATDDGSNGWISEAGYTVTGSVDYATGVVAVDITGSIAGTVSVKYTQDNAAADEGDIVVTKKQICALQSTLITSIGYVS